MYFMGIFHFLILFHPNNLVQPKMNWSAASELEENPQTSDERTAPADTDFGLVTSCCQLNCVPIKFIY